MAQILKIKLYLVSGQTPEFTIYPKAELDSAEIEELGKMFIGMPQHVKGVLDTASPMIAFNSEHITFVEIKQNFVEDEIY